MSDASPVFPFAEHDRRCRALQSQMAACGQDVLLLTSPADIFYLTGFLTRFWESPARPWFILVPAKGKPMAVIPEIGRDLMMRCYVGEILSWPAPVPGDDGVSLLAETLVGLVPENGVIGTPMGLETSLRMPLGDFRRLEKLVGGRQFVDATDTVQRVREVKSEAEIAAIRVACACADTAFLRVPEIVLASTGVDDVFRRFQMALLEAGADWVSYVAGGAGPNGYGNVIAPAEAVPFADGNILMLDTGAVKAGYFCDYDRNYAIGTARDPALRAHEALYQATDALLTALSPGMRACDAHAILTDALTAAGAMSAGGRLGHGLGVTLTEWPSFTALDQTELRAGMVLTIEPGVVVEEGRIMVHEENIVLRDNGPELLSSRAPAELPVIPL